MKHWHDCQRWSSRGFSCPFRFIEMEEERQEEPEQPEVRDGRQIRHAALAQERQTVPVTADLRIRNWHGFAEAQTSLVNAGVVQAVSSQAVPPFEKPTGVPTYIGQQEGREIESQQTAAAVSAPAISGGVSTPARLSPPPSASPTDPFGANTQNAGALRDPRVVEDRLAFALASAVAPGPAQAIPAPARVGAPTTIESLGHAGDVAQWRTMLLQDRITAYFDAMLGLKETFVLESFLTAAVIYGTFKSFEAFKAYMQQRGTPFPDRGRITPPKPLLQGTPSGSKPFVPRRSPGAGAVASGTGDIPGQGNFLREFRAGLRQGEQP